VYQVPQFRESDLATQHAFIQAHPLGLLISTGPEGVIANPIPFLLYAEGERGVLRCHLSRGNAQWRALQARADALVVFQGPEHYISPSWYPSKREHGKTVPTWNYATVQARGTARIMEDAAWLLAHVTALSDSQEGGRQEPWTVADAPESYIAGQLKGIVGIEIPIASLDGKFKASQNRPAADRAGVVSGLDELGDGRALEMRDLVRARNGI
jgi:transcriptional regulator